MSSSSATSSSSTSSEKQYLCDATKYSKFFFFWNEETCFSQWVKAPMKVNDQTFSNCEQFMMYQKALLFNDQEIAKRILQSTNPKNTKALGRKVSNFNEKIWEDNKVRIVYEGNYAKFAQNDDLRKDLLSRPDVEYVEASPYDKIWGIGLEEKDPRAKQRNEWQGQNLLGRIITQVRDDLMMAEMNN
ncbi:hypothetical protein NAEGRDRAFT_31151 [Naegleria gruberi]|uniref:NADAR domain-containing protein n=1 Tax=Naegleria gruberi TaxID=5762 RepID=D2V5D5_NAEGR|nr:uncharacterized protein NAEGRDRAFT_31151 [Naegleria gruberi]EFC47933.1 hypothetical protein NAEGRDRAFT_31151 [Naegleria gruberi]|eukprot:XP_002680677.1 hypothetical protein NAEGRDRAFT_31151 [Naegleria gruberi strain NEG-M]